MIRNKLAVPFLLLLIALSMPTCSSPAPSDSLVRFADLFAESEMDVTARGYTRFIHNFIFNDSKELRRWALSHEDAVAFRDGALVVSVPQEGFSMRRMLQEHQKGFDTLVVRMKTSTRGIAKVQWMHEERADFPLQGRETLDLTPDGEVHNYFVSVDERIGMRGAKRELIFLPLENEGTVEVHSISLIQSNLSYEEMQRAGEKIEEKVKVGEEVRKVILAPAPSRMEKSILIPRDARLDFGIALSPHVWDHKGDGVQFNIHLTDEKRGETNTVFSRYLDPKNRPDHRKWFDQSIDLSSYGGREMKIVFETRGSRDSSAIDEPKDEDTAFDLAYWSNPVLYCPGFQEKDLNILFVCLDTLRADHLGCYGYERKTSPIIDQMAKDGILFEHAISQAPATYASHMSLFTSLFPSSHFAGKFSEAIMAEHATLAQLLRSAGYNTVAFTEDGGVGSVFGFHRGFNLFSDGPQKGKAEGDKNIHLTFASAIEWMKKYGNRKFFLFLHTYQTHLPYLLAPPYDTMFDPDYKGPLPNKLTIDMAIKINTGQVKANERDLEHINALYDGTIAVADTYMGKLRQALKKEGLDKNTMVILFSDHGEDFYDHAAVATHGHTLYRELLHVPFIILMPHGDQAGRRIAKRVQLVDLMPTLLDFLELPSPSTLQGTSFFSLLKEKEKGDGTDKGKCISENMDTFISTSLHEGQYKYIYTPESENLESKAGGIFQRLPRLRRLLKEHELYDTETDPGEQRNIAAENPLLVEKYLKMVYDHRASSLGGIHFRVRNGGAETIQVKGFLETKGLFARSHNLYLEKGDSFDITRSSLLFDFTLEPQDEDGLAFTHLPSEMGVMADINASGEKPSPENVHLGKITLKELLTKKPPQKKGPWPFNLMLFQEELTGKAPTGKKRDGLHFYFWKQGTLKGKQMPTMDAKTKAELQRLGYLPGEEDEEGGKR